ncbi:MAG: MBL fold metallo-hydrolase [Methanocalculus sp. MSAO_Arc1]|uniref:MBL fold metallo-hydrolase n=1 Tax=Methanocalculus TaxID=71151 RepID=UPI000FF276BF|nr:MULTISPECIES: MBL fold metallo-hydrolase [unclassified Methanocalculus]MCP1661415.1 glyoxylase-like metal-dependent hydrolase (beta-lactamase superfamily II) [Methanocalculus sp. AMF5]RQD79692.1 MAG: MBL fold metallo-hydrolase [Methanocalculus sp. MSAO_Arc1]
MKIINLTEESELYTSNVYLVTGDWKTLDDQNTLIDTGRDQKIIGMLASRCAGVGKRKLDQVILTHSHYDHASLTHEIREIFAPTVYAHADSRTPVDIRLRGKETLRIGDRLFEVIHTPGHTEDSICLFCEEEGVLFVGDTIPVIGGPGCTYDERFLEALQYIASKDVRAIYYGHGRPMLGNCNAIIAKSIMNIRQSRSHSGSSPKE